MKTKRYESIWDAIENEPGISENMKIRSILMQELVAHITKTSMTKIGGQADDFSRGSRLAWARPICRTPFVNFPLRCPIAIASIQPIFKAKACLAIVVMLDLSGT